MKMNITQEQFQMMVEDITSELVQSLVEQRSYDLPRAIEVVYSSKTYDALTRPSTGLYNQSTGYIMSYLQKELKLYPLPDDTQTSKVAEDIKL